jgi:hypothetical protein
MNKMTFKEDGGDAWKKFLQVMAAIGLLRLVQQLIENGKLTFSQIVKGLGYLGTLGWTWS